MSDAVSLGVPAPLGRRLAARLLDLALLGGLLVVGAFTVNVSLGELEQQPDGTLTDQAVSSVLGATLAFLAIVAFAWLVYEAGMHSWRGATLGKLALGLRVVETRTGEPPSGGTATLRWLVPFAGTLLCVVGVIAVYASPLLDQERYRRGWHDRAAGTVVVLVPDDDVHENR